MDDLIRRADHDRSDSPLSWLVGQLSRSPIVTIPITAVEIADSLRSDGDSEQHIRLLAESGATLPPIIVHKPTMRVVDGLHRIKAAVLRGDANVAARLYDGSVADAFILAVRANVTHGLPLPLDDRVKAATRIVASHPAWSDRAIAAAAGLSPKTVAAIRLRATADPGSPPRIGRDGRIRPVSTAAGRRLAGELMTRNPDASLRQIARAVGLAPSTIMDVRDRLLAGQDLVPDNQLTSPKRRPRAAMSTAASARAPTCAAITDRTEAINILRQDPSLRFSETGRRFLRWLDSQPNAAPDWRLVVDNLPEHCLEIVADLARDCAAAWSTVVDRLERRAHSRAPHPNSVAR